jgi:excisionase family DNA binding protein
VDDVKPYLTIPEIAKICSMDRSTIYRWVSSGKIKSFCTPGGHKRIQPKDLQIFFNENHIPIELNGVEKRKTKILIVDDDPGVQKYLGKILSGPLIEIDFASDGFEAGTKLFSFQPQLMILDLFMPNMDGFEVCRYIKQNKETQNIKILVLTGRETEENKKKVMSLGADDFLPKSSTKEEILNHVERLL